jgi:hypothetical protein
MLTNMSTSNLVMKFLFKIWFQVWFKQSHEEFICGRSWALFLPNWNAASKKPYAETNKQIVRIRHLHENVIVAYFIKKIRVVFANWRFIACSPFTPLYILSLKCILILSFLLRTDVPTGRDALCYLLGCTTVQSDKSSQSCYRHWMSMNFYQSVRRYIQEQCFRSGAFSGTT